MHVVLQGLSRPYPGQSHSTPLSIQRSGTAGKTTRRRQPFIVLLLLLCCCCSRLQAQTATISMKAVPVQKVLKELSRQTKISIVYNEAIFKDLPPVTIDVRNAPINEVLDKCLEGKGFQRNMEGNIISIKKAPAPTPAAGSSQDAAIRGMVLDKEGKPVEGATILLKGPISRSTTADASGSFVFTGVPAGKYMLTVTSVGFEKQAKQISMGDNNSSLNFVLDKQWAESEQVVVNGIYSRPKENFTGAATSFTGEELRQVNPTSILQALKSLDASIQMPADNVMGSDPNTLPRFQVRGTNSIMQTDLKSEYGYISNPPLIIIDGFESTLQALFDMDINRIARVTVLKDAAATAIYGSKSANGVLVIQTVQPKSGKTQVNYTTTLGINMPDLGSFDLMNAQEKMELERIAGLYRNRNFSDQQKLNDKYNLVLHNVEQGVNTYWLSQPLQTEFSHAHTLSLSAGTERFVYMGTFSYKNNGGIMKGSMRNNLDGILNVRYTSKDKRLQFQTQFSIGAMTAHNSPYGDFGNYAKLNPYWMARDQHGNITRYVDIYPTTEGTGLINAAHTPSVVNPLWNTTLNTVDKNSSLNIQQNFWVEYLLVKNLKVNATFSYNTGSTESHKFLPGTASQFFNQSDFTERGSYDKGTGKSHIYQGNATLNYGRNFGKHTLYTTAGLSIQQNSSENLAISVKGFPSSRLDDLLFGLTYSGTKPTGAYTITRTVGYLGNASYAYDNRYLLDLSLRSDGSSVFGTDKRFGQLWSVGTGWNVHNEHFIRLPKFMSRLKLTGTYGFTGSVNFPSYAAATTYKYITTGRYLDFVPATITAMGNPDLVWQRTKKGNLGADFGLFNNRLSVNVDFYNETTDDLIMANQSAPSTGFPEYHNNLGKSQNRGYEVSVSAFILRNPARKLYWSISTSFYRNENKLLQITDVLKAQNQAAKDLQASGGYNKPVLQYQEGKSLSTLYAVRSLGIDAATGYEIFLTKDGKQTYVWNVDDAVAMGDMQPKLNLTFTNNFQYKWIRLNFAVRVQTGAVLYNNTLVDKLENADLTMNMDRRALSDRWQTPGVPADYKGLTDLEGYTRTSDPTAVTSRFVQKANTIEITGISLDPGALLERYITKYTNLLINKLNAKTDDVLKSNMVSVRFYMNNAFTITSLKRERGTSYPFNRTYSLNISLQL
ncbi:MAG: SusC/RagA family TonB-linked outer membrane protein [Candidatus Pseudobacter hemicellulosilyticus]|uniref:SusC/RagA family TonB-linked outer membrane protein n=1 Tax=Candidatus Pseudobacter hemicellulosilyticus TaxID=3121375 RepID=A0AAJ5WQY3_9BACT|nr:MAG: SusC/RagA family TonB-linked outer membrane protein [Pseudobacter sp.]